MSKIYSYTFPIPLHTIRTSELNNHTALKSIQKSLEVSVTFRRTMPHYKGFGNGSCQISGQKMAIYQALALMVALVRLSSPSRYCFWTHRIISENILPFEDHSSPGDDEKESEILDNSAAMVPMGVLSNSSDCQEEFKLVTPTTQLITSDGSLSPPSRTIEPNEDTQRSQFGSPNQTGHPPYGSTPRIFSSEYKAWPDSISPKLERYHGSETPNQMNPRGIETTRLIYSPGRTSLLTGDSGGSVCGPSTLGRDGKHIEKVEKSEDPALEIQTNNFTQELECPQSLDRIVEGFNPIMSAPDEIKPVGNVFHENSLEISLEALEFLSQKGFRIIREVIIESQSFCRLSRTPNSLTFLAVGTELQVSIAMISISVRLKEFFSRKSGSET